MAGETQFDEHGEIVGKVPGEETATQSETPEAKAAREARERMLKQLDAVQKMWYATDSPDTRQHLAYAAFSVAFGKGDIPWNNEGFDQALPERPEPPTPPASAGALKVPTPPPADAIGSPIAGISHSEIAAPLTPAAATEGPAPIPFNAQAAAELAGATPQPVAPVPTTGEGPLAPVTPLPRATETAAPASALAGLSTAA